ncbi:MAG: DUF1624 domain-containing protein [Oligoflexia bacterium]|nr:DUF1624 domain-containing protein [Oligoflexia bacterium]
MSGGARFEAIDLARGIAIALMILSHGVKGLLPFEQIPAWGLVPVHLITKISSSLFILVFGVSLALGYLRAVGTDAWPAKRLRLWMRGVEVLCWYKLLTIVEMAGQYSSDEVLDALLYRAFPVYVEILGFYALALLWLPLVLPLWKRAPLWSRVLSVPAVAALATLLHQLPWNAETLQAIFVEHEKHYTWGQLSRAPLVFLGLLLGQGLQWSQAVPRRRLLFSVLLGAAGGAMLLALAFDAAPELRESLVGIAKNAGKHPPEVPFLLFSVGGAFLVLSLVQAGGRRLAVALRPLTLLGKESLQAFVFHIVVLFIVYRGLFDYWHRVSYSFALSLTALLLGLTVVWVRFLRGFSS